MRTPSNPPRWRHAARILIAAAASVGGQGRAGTPEPDIAQANRWWPRLTNVFTPIGWKNHLFRFNVFYNGMIMADPCPEHASPALARWRGLGAQVGILPSEGGLDPDRWRAGTYQMTGEAGRRWGHQGLLDRPAPVIWTEWRQAFRACVGYVVRQEVFAHVPGGQEIVTGDEPLFAWIRLSVGDVNPLVRSDRCGILVKINKPHWFPEMYEGRNCALRTTDALYPRALRLERVGSEDAPGFLVIEPDDRIRIAVLPRERVDATFAVRAGNHGQDSNLHVTIPAAAGEFVDLLLPMIPAKRDALLAEMRRGRDAVLRECDAYWSRVPASAARIRTPERTVNGFLRRNAQYGEIIAQRMPDGGHYTNLTGSLVYARMWATPTAMFDTMLLDTLGYHEAVDRYLEIFRATQGEVKPPGPSYDRHPGYLATPPDLTAVDWLSDHGAILHAVSYHALLTDDRAFIERWREPILRACAFIRDARRKTDRDGVRGVLPPAVATDRGVPTQAVWNIGWNYRGLASAVRLLERIGHPQAGAWAREADDYRSVFVRALRDRTARMPAWTDGEGTVHRAVPMSLSAGGDITHGFYLDTGPLFLVYAGLLPAGDPLMRSALRFFREGPNRRLYDPGGHHEQPPVLVREISSCEPCASFNIFHSHQSGDRLRFLEGMYSMLAGAHSRRTYIACETRGGVTGLAGHIGIYAVRLAAIDDLVDPEALHLLRLVPLAWLRSDRETRFENVPTIFGPVDLRFGLAEGGRSLRVAFAHRFHHPPRRILIHIPPVAEVEELIAGGRSSPARAGQVIPIE
ncbi:MAG: hypothetical protein JXP34_04600 [Planctomycetes bacterium]|nr:hypothetical protein [Planctomycetota bacterium]